MLKPRVLKQVFVTQTQDHIVLLELAQKPNIGVIFFVKWLKFEIVKKHFWKQR
jgi:hypothetical protein